MSSRSKGKGKRLPKRNLLLDLVLLSVSGLGTWLAFPDHNLWFLLPFTIALLIGIVDRVSAGRAAFYSAWWTLVFMLPLISWMQIATGNTLIAWFALAGAQAFFLALWGASFAVTRVWPWSRRLFGEALTAALLWVAFEELRSRLPFGGFPWGKLAYPQVNGPLIGLAPLGGEVLTGFAVVVVAVCLRHAFDFGRGVVGEQGLLPRLGAAAVALVVFMAPIFIPLSNRQESGELEVAVIQGNVELPMAETFAIPRKVTGNHHRESFRMLDSGREVDLIIWGENAADIDPREDPETAALIGEVASSSGVPVLFGFMEYREDERFNWSAVWDPEQGLLPDKYGKQHPVPWGEYIPFRELTEFLATAAAQVTIDLVAVDNQPVLDIQLSDGREVRVAVGICFEVAYEPLIAEGITEGGEIIVIPTNNAHFQNSAESVQQAQMAQFRAVEFSRSAIQASTNGVSAIIKPDGSIQAQTQTQEAGYLVASLPLRTSLTPFSRTYQLWPILAMAGGLGLTTLALVARVRTARSSPARRGVKARSPQTSQARTAPGKPKGSKRR